MLEGSGALDELVGEEICHLRLGAGLSQGDLGAKIGITSYQLHRYESGRASISVARLAKVAAVLGVEPGHFFGRGSAGRNLSPTQPADFLSKKDLELAGKIARIRDDAQRRDIIRNIEQTVDLILRSRDSVPDTE